MAELPATRANALALADEQALMRQGHAFLDEKRMLLAAETLRRLAAHQAQEAELVEAVRAAAESLRAALQRHGRAGLGAQPAAPPPTLQAAARSRFLGVTLWQAGGVDTGTPAHAGADPSPEARACRDAFAALLAPLAALAQGAGNLERLGAEYRRTERRTLALENVLLPEVKTARDRIDEHLTLADQEEAVRIRHAAQRGGGNPPGSITQMG
jgi:V/A-type H+-transporting ATPase subunit D